MKKVFFVVAFGQVLTLSAQQFNGGATNTTTDIYRSGNIGLGQTSAVTLGAKLHVAQSQGTSQIGPVTFTPTTDIRLERRTYTGVGSASTLRYWDINNTGTTLSFLTGTTTTTTNVMEVSSTGLAIGATNAKGALQIGDKFVIHNGTDKIIGCNFYNNGTDRRIVTTDNVAAIRFTSTGNINFQTASSNAISQITTWTNGLTILNDGKVGIGTITPSQKLHIVGNTVIEGSLTVKGTASSSPILNIDPNGIVKIDNARLVISNSSGNQLEINSDGKVHARQFDVDLQTIPDYVFNDNYDLMELDSLREYIKENHHLPKIKSEEEYKAIGTINVNELTLQLLEKVEELTLYNLQLQDRIKALETLNSSKH